MPYNITLSNGTDLITGGLLDNTADTTNTSLTLVGKNYKGYGLFLNQNFARLMENFANASAPAAPLPGQVWYNSTTKRLNVNISATKGTLDANWKSIAGLTLSASTPTSQFTGELWYDTTNGQLKIYAGTEWRTVGPLSRLATGNTGAIPDTVTDAPPTTTYVVIKFFIDNVLVGIWSKDGPFNSDVPGFATIQRGINLNSSLGHKFYGNATVAESLLIGSTPISGTSLLRNDQSGSTTGSLSILNDAGLSVGAANDFVANVVSGTVILKNQTANRDFILSLKIGANQIPFLRGNSQTGLSELYVSPTASSSPLSVASKNYVDILSGAINGTANFFGHITPSANLVYTLGNTTNRWTNIFSESILVGNVNAANLTVTNGNVTQIFIGTDIIPTLNVASNLGSVGMRFNTLHARDSLLSSSLNVGANTSVGGILTVTGNTFLNSNLSASGMVTLSAATTSTSTNTGALVIAGGVGIAGNLNVGGPITAPTMPVGTANTAVATTAFVTATQFLPSGGLMMWPAASAPSGWLLCNGTAVSRTTYAALFAVIGTTFGVGDGSTTFNLPNYTNRGPVGAGGLYAMGATGGSKDAITVSHTHTLSGGGTSGTFVTAVSETKTSLSTDGFFGVTVVTDTSTSTGSPSYSNPTVNSSGSSGTDANMQPYLAINFIIKT
jgi:microcystin-dependent protein